MDRKQLEKILSHPLFVVIVTIISLISIFSLQKSSRQALVSKESIEKIEKNVALTEKELLEEQKKIHENQEEIILEKIMRNELLQKKDGEIILQVPDGENLTNYNHEELRLKKNKPLEEWKKLLRN